MHKIKKIEKLVKTRKSHAFILFFKAIWQKNIIFVGIFSISKILTNKIKEKKEK